MEMQTKLLSDTELRQLCGEASYTIRKNNCGTDQVIVSLFGDTLPNLNLVFSRRLPIGFAQGADICGRMPYPLLAAFPPFSSEYSRLEWRITLDNFIQGDYNGDTEEFYITSTSPTHTLLVMRHSRPIPNGLPQDCGDTEEINTNPKFVEWVRTSEMENGMAIYYIMFSNR